MSRRPALLTALLLAAPALAAEEPTAMGLQVRGSIPESGLADTLGGSKIPGVGASLLLEEDFGEYFEGWRGRLGLGFDLWFKGNAIGLPGTTAKVRAANLTVEAVRMLRPRTPARGPYVSAGAGYYEWSVTTSDSAGESTARGGKVAFSIGFGWRLTGSLDFEVKALMGQMPTGITAGALVVAATARF